MTPSPDDLRQQAMSTGLSLLAATASPIEQFRDWFEQAQAAGAAQPRAMALATVNQLGHPTARMVLLAGYDPRGFDFATDARSPKIEDAQRQPWVALVFYWVELERQVRVEGQLETLDKATADRYYFMRSRESQLAAWLPQQSQVIAGRDLLETQLLDLFAEHEHQPIRRPAYYQAYRVKPVMVEFWQARTDHINDRLRYTQPEAGSWQVELLAP